MSNRTLTYTIKLLSDIARNSNRDAQAVESSAKRMGTAYDTVGRNAARSTKTAERAIQQLNGSAVRTGAALDNMGSSMGARLAKNMGIGIASLKQMRSVAEKTGSALDKIGKGAGMTMVGGVAATAAANYVLTKPVDYDAKAQDIANTAAKDSDAAGKITEKYKVKSAVEAALAESKGGTHDEVLGLLGTMLSAGVDKKDAYAQLPMLAKTQIASRMDGETLGALTSVFKAAEIDPSKWGNMHSEGIRVGQDGTFEYASMAKNGLSEMVMSNKAMGMSGVDSFRQAISDLQLLKKATGNDATAATDYKNFQAKITASDTVNRLQKDFKIDLPAELQKGAVKGQSPIDTMMKVADKIYKKEGKGDEYQKRMLEIGQLKKNGADQATIDQRFAAIAALDKTGVMAEILPDMQAGFGMRALQQFAPDGFDFRKAMLADNGRAMQTNWEANISTPYAAMQRGESAKDTAAQNALDQGGSSVVSNVYDGFSDLAAELPGVAAGLSGLAAVTSIVGAGFTSVGVLGFGLDWLKKRKNTADPSDPSKPSTPSESKRSAKSTGTTAAVDKPESPRRRNAAGQLIGEHAEPLPYTGSRKNSKFIGPMPSSDPHLLNVSEEADTIMKKAAKQAEQISSARMAGRVGGLASAAVGAYTAYEVISDEHSTRGQKAQGLTEAAGAGLGGWGGASAGAAAGAAFGTFVVPIIGTAIGGVIGGLAGGFFGSKYGGEAGHAAGDVARTAIDGSDPAQMTAAVQAGVTQGMASMPSIMQQPPAYMTQPLLNMTPPPLQAVDLSIKDGKLQVQVQVNASSQLIEATARASTPSVPLQLAGGGNTNPASYNYGGQR